MFCENCGAAIDDDSKFCNVCGYQIGVGPGPAAEAGKQGGFLGKLKQMLKKDKTAAQPPVAPAVPPIPPVAPAVPPIPPVAPAVPPVAPAVPPVPPIPPVAPAVPPMPPTPLAMEDEEEDRTVALEPEFMEPVTVEPTGVIRLQAGEGGAIYDCSLAEPVVIGRDENACKIVISGNKSISRKHCRIYQQDGNCYVEDLNSFNHTYVNHEMVSEPTQIRAGDSLSLGALEFVVAEIDLEASV